MAPYGPSWNEFEFVEPSKPAAKAVRKGMSAAGRKRIAEAQKVRWAKQKRAAKKAARETATKKALKKTATKKAAKTITPAKESAVQA